MFWSRSTIQTSPNPNPPPNPADLQLNIRRPKHPWFASHVYYVLYTTKMIWTPGFLSRIFSESAYFQRRYEEVADDFGDE